MSYFHRIGRTARAGASGKAFTLVSQEDYDSFESILQHTKVPVKRLNEEMGVQFEITHTQPAKRKHGFRGGRGGEGFSRGRRGFRSGKGRRDFKSRASRGRFRR
jgi:ATP-dependent RNA helicase DeaD